MKSLVVVVRRIGVGEFLRGVDVVVQDDGRWEFSGRVGHLKKDDRKAVHEGGHCGCQEEGSRVYM
jgi:hypothetical protein